VVDYVSNNMDYVWEAEFDFLKKTKKEIMLSWKESGNIPSYLGKKIQELCGQIFYAFDPLSK